MFQILLVEDQKEFQLIVRKALGSRYEVVCKDNLKDAFREIERRNFDLILLDVNLPDGDVFQACARFQKEERTLRIPIIFLTAQTGVSSRVTGFAVGGDDYLEKPFDGLELIARVDAKMIKINAKRDDEEILLRGDLNVETRPVSNGRSNSFLDRPSGNILILEDDPEFATTLSHVLFRISPNLRTIWVNSLVNATHAINGGHFELIIADYFLGDHGTGLDFWAACKRKMIKAPFILTSGMGTERYIRLTSGMLAPPSFIPKPFKIDECKETLMSLIDSGDWNLDKQIRERKHVS